MEPVPDLTPLLRFGGFLGVANWTQMLLDTYTEESPRGETLRKLMDRQVVVELRQYKERSSSEHEYTVARIRISDGSYHFLRFDRNAQPSEPTSASRYITSIATSNTFSNTSSLALSNLLCAIDTVSALSDWPITKKRGPDAVRLIGCVEFEFPNNRPTLLDLALVARITHDYGNEYHIFSRQCFWYASVIARTLQKIAPSSNGIPINEDEVVEVVHNKAAGTWGNVRIGDVLPKHADSVYESYQEEKKASMAKIMGADRAYKDIAQRAADYGVQKRLKEEAEQRAEESSRETEVARKGEEEARRREQDLLREIATLRAKTTLAPIFEVNTGSGLADDGRTQAYRRSSNSLH